MQIEHLPHRAALFCMQTYKNLLENVSSVQKKGVNLQCKTKIKHRI